MDGSVQNILYPVDLFYGPWDFFFSTMVLIKIKKKKIMEELCVLPNVPDCFYG